MMMVVMMIWWWLWFDDDDDVDDDDGDDMIMVTMMIMMMMMWWWWWWWWWWWFDDDEDVMMIWWWWWCGWFDDDDDDDDMTQIYINHFDWNIALWHFAKLPQHTWIINNTKNTMNIHQSIRYVQFFRVSSSPWPAPAQQSLVPGPKSGRWRFAASRDLGVC